MSKFKYIFLVFAMFLFMTDIVDAEQCDTQDINRLKEIADKVEVKTSYVGSNAGKNKSTFKITMSNLSDEIYVVSDFLKHYDFYNGETYSYEMNYEDRYVLDIYSNKCEVELRTVEIDMSEYNNFAFYDECNNISGNDLKVCDVHYKGKLNNETFKDAIKEYNEKNKSNIKQIIKNNKGMFITSIVVVILGIVSIIVYNKISFKVRGKLE